VQFFRSLVELVNTPWSSSLLVNSLLGLEFRFRVWGLRFGGLVSVVCAGGEF
jgi:hypothetical protein